MAATLDMPALLETSDKADHDLDLDRLSNGIFHGAQVLAANRLIGTANALGFVVGRLDMTLQDPPWDDPHQFTWFVGGWGHEQERRRHIANAMRTLRPTLRVKRGTLDLLTYQRDDLFRDEVQSQERDGSYPWGDYREGCADFVHVGPLIIPVAVDGLLAVENQALLLMIGGLVGAELLKRRNPLMWGPQSTP